MDLKKCMLQGIVTVFFKGRTGERLSGHFVDCLRVHGGGDAGDLSAHAGGGMLSKRSVQVSKFCVQQDSTGFIHFLQYGL